MACKYTQHQIDRLKREAKKLRKTGDLTHVQALDQIAEREGFPSWWHLQHGAGVREDLDLVRFSIDPKDTESITESELAKAGIAEDPEFLEFLVQQEEDPEAAMDLYTWERAYRFKSWRTTDLDEIVEKVREVFFFPPVRVWVGGREATLSTYAAPDMFVFRG